MTDIAKLGLEVESGQVRTAKNDLQDFSKEAEKAEKEAAKLEKEVEKLGKTMGGVVVKGIGTVTAVVGAAIYNFIEAEQVSQQLAAQLEITGNRAGRSAEQIDKLARTMQGLTRFDDESIKRGAAALTRFGSIAGDNFDRALKLSADLAQALGSDIPSAAQTLGRAMETSFGAQMLRRQGLLNDEQVRMIKNMKELGRDAEAQEMLFAALEERVGGLAEKMGERGLGSALIQLKNQVGELLESFGEWITKGLGVEDMVRGLSDTIRDFNEGKKGVIQIGVQVPDWLAGKIIPGYNAGKNIGSGIAHGVQQFFNPGTQEEMGPGRDQLFSGLAGQAAQAAASHMQKYNEYTQRQTELMDQLIIKDLKQRDAIKTKGDLIRIVTQEWNNGNKLLIDSYGSIDEAVKALEDNIPKMAKKAKKETDLWFETMQALGKEAEKELAAGKRRTDELDRQIQKEIDARNKEAKEIADGITKQRERIKQIDEETEKIGKTANEIDDLTIARLKERRAITETIPEAEEYVKLLNEEIAALERRRKARSEDDAAKYTAEQMKKAAEESARAAEKIGDTITDALMRAFESGKDFAQSFRDTLINMFKTLILRPTIQAVMAPVAGAFSGPSAAFGGVGGGGGGMGNLLSMFGGGGGGGGGGMLGGLFGDLGSTFGPVIGGLGSLAGGVGAVGAFGPIVPTFGTALLGGMAAPLATAGGLFAGGGAAFGGGMAALGAGLGAAIPIVGIALAIAAALGAFDRGGPKVGGSASNIPDIGRFFTPNQGDAQVQKIVDAQTRSFSQVLSSLGGKGTGQFAFGFDDDPEGDAQSRISVAAAVNGRRVYGFTDRDVGGDMEDVEKALQLEAQRALLAALQASDLPEEIAKILNYVNASTADADAVQNVIRVATAIKSVLDITKSVGEAGLSAYEDSLKGVNFQIEMQIDAVQKLMDNLDSSTESIEELAGAANALYQNAVQAVAQIDALKAQLGDMFSSSIFNYRLAGQKDDKSRYDFIADQVDKWGEELRTATDTNRISQLAQWINQGQNQLFGMMTPEMQQQNYQQFVTAAEEANKLVQERLEAARKTITDAVDKMIADVKDMLIDAADRQYAAANIMLDAANKMVTAANQPTRVEVTQRGGLGYDVTGG